MFTYDFLRQFKGDPRCQTFGVGAIGSRDQAMLPPNPDDGNKVPGHNWAGGQAGEGGPDEFNPDVLKDPDRSLLISYVGGNVALFRCPADKREGCPFE